MSLRDKVEHAIQNQPCTVKDLKARFGGDRGADRKVMEALDSLVHDAVICQRSGVFFTVRSGRAEKALLCKVVKLGKNFAFVMLEDGTSDIFIPGRFTRGAMPGDKVLVPNPGYPTYTSLSKLLGAHVVNYSLDEANGWQPDWQQLEAMDLSGVRLMWTNYPNMPTGANASPELYLSLIHI